MREFLQQLYYLIFFWKPLPFILPGVPRTEPAYLERGDKLTIHHPVSWIERLLIRVHGVELEIY